MKIFSVRIVLVVFLALCGKSFSQYGVPAQGGDVKSQASLIAHSSAFSPGESSYLYLALDHPEGWYSYYYNNTVPFTVRPDIKFQTHPHLTFGTVEYPVPETKTSYGVPNYVFTGRTLFRVPVTIGASVPDGQVIKVKGAASWQICKESCLSEKRDLSLSFQVLQRESGRKVEDLSSYDSVFPTLYSSLLSARHVDGQINLKVPKARGQLHFFDLDGQVNVASQYAELRSVGVATLQLPLDEGNEIRYDRHVPKGRLRGILLLGDLAYRVDQKVENVPVSTVVEEELDFSSPFSVTVEEPVATESRDYATLYDASQPIPYQTLSGAAPMTFWFALGGAFLGGILLNLMPCVFPVLSLKVLSFVEKSGEKVWKVRLHGMLFTLGVLASMWALTIGLFAFKNSTGQAINWGQQMGDPRVVAGIILVLFLFGLNMASVFEFGTKLSSLGSSGEAKKGDGFLGTFFSGVLTTVVATPCSGPFLGAAMGYTLEQKLPVALVLFTVFSLGISVPYLLLSFFPSLTAKMPRPGAWMETLKKILSFGMFAAAAFFMKAFGAQVGHEGLAGFVMSMVLIALAAYMYGHWSRPHFSSRVRYGLGYGLALAVLLYGVGMMWNAATDYEAPQEKPKQAQSKGGIPWVAWSPGIVEYERARGNYVWVDYTASWCATCLVNKSRIFGDADLVASLDLDRMTFVKADMTQSPPELAKDLSRVNRAQIPVNLLYAPEMSREALLLEELISVSDVRKGLERIGYSASAVR